MCPSIVDVVFALNTLARTGWMLRGVPSAICETVSQHSFSASIIALCIAEELRKRDRNLDPYRAALLALVHDLPEAFTGDILSVFSRRYIPMKKEAELSILSEKIDSDILKELYREYAEQETIESRIAKLSDYIATYVQAVNYKSVGYRVDDIIENMYENIVKIAEDLELTDLVKQMISPQDDNREGIS